MLDKWARLQAKNGLPCNSVSIPHADFVLLMKEYTPCFRSSDRAVKEFHKALRIGVAVLATSIGIVKVSCNDFPGEDK